MNIITILLCALANQVMSKTDIVPVKILAQQKTISENSHLYLTCSTFGFKKPKNVFIYLCKDGKGIQKIQEKESQNDSTFIIGNVGTNYSGNYSCVYSQNKYSPSKVAMEGSNIIQILVIDISVSGPSNVSDGANVEFRCTVSDTLQTLDECQLIHSYLRKNGTILQVQAFNVTRKEATFTIGGAVMRDSGLYSCVVLPSKCIQEHEKILHGNNAVFLQVRDEESIWKKESLVFRVVFSWGVINQMLLLALCLWWINIKACHSALCNPCGSQQANKDVFEEQEEQTEGDDLGGQYDESFSMDDEGSQNGLAVEDSNYYGNCEAMYNVADESSSTDNKEGSQNGLAVKDSTYYDDCEAVYDVADESSSTDNKEGSQNGLAVKDSTYHDDCEAVYDVADDEPSRPEAVPFYTMSFKTKRHKISPVC